MSPLNTHSLSAAVAARPSHLEEGGLWIQSLS